MNIFERYTKWLHTKWPAGIVEKLPQVNPDGSSNIPGLYIVGDLTGIPLLKFSADSGARAIQAILSDPDFQKARANASDQNVIDVVIVGAGVSGMAAALEARKRGLSFEILEATEPFSTIVNFPKGKPIFTYPTDMTPAGDLQFMAQVKEPLVEELKAQTLKNGITPRMARVEKVVKKDGHYEVVIPKLESVLARRVIVGIGRSGDFRKLGVQGENHDKVFNRLHDPKDYTDQNVLVVGGGDSALETAIAIAQCGGYVTISYRKEEFSRPKPDNVERLNKLMADPMADVAIETPTSERVTTSSGGFMGDANKPGRITLMMQSRVKNIGEMDVTLFDAAGKEVTLPNDAVFSMIGREAPLEFFRRTGVKITGELGWKGWTGFGLFFLFCLFVYNWKAGGDVTRLFQHNNWFPFNVPSFVTGLGESIAAAAADKATVLGTMMISIGEGGFYYALVYSLLVIVFGYKRIKRRKTPYVKMQTLSLATIQLVPLFLLPYFLLPYLGNNGAFDSGIGKSIADALFPVVNYGHGREYWRAFGIILAWPLFVWNVFTSQPLWWWLGISLVQTFVIIPGIVYFWGKGAYCGWICSCGAMAETLGDTHRHKMPHGAPITANVKNLKDSVHESSDQIMSQLDDNAQNMVTQLSDTIWVLKNEHLPITKLADRFKAWTQRLIQNYPNVKYHYNEQIENDITFTPEKILDIFLILKECVNNALKHSECSDLRINFKSDQNWVISIEDNGKGFDTIHRGDGINNIKRRADVCGWVVEWREMKPSGTRVTIFETTTK